mgnify:CR=1 FL=1
MSKPLTIRQIEKDVLNMLGKAFDHEYRKARPPVYTKRWNYGRFNIYKTEYSIEFDRPHTTTLAKGLTQEEADGFMKLLENYDE